MPQKGGKKGGKKARRGKKTEVYTSERKLRLLDVKQDEMLAVVMKRMGGVHIKAYCADDKDRLVVIRGKFTKRIWLNPGDVIIIRSYREFKQDSEKSDTVYKYRKNEIRSLRNNGELDFAINAGIISEVVIEEKVEEKKYYSYNEIYGNIMESGEEDESDEESDEESGDELVIQKNKNKRLSESDEDSEDSQVEFEEEKEDSEEIDIDDI